MSLDLIRAGRFEPVAASGCVRMSALRQDAADAAVPFKVSVRALCEFAAKRGDLDRRFSPSPTAQEGVAGHRTVTARRTRGYQSEVALSLVHRNLLVRGRADGYVRDAALVEEIKTFRGDLARMPANRRALHRAQADTYAWMLCRRDGLDGIAVALVYYDVDRDIELPALVEHRGADDLRREFEALCDAFVAWAEAERTHRTTRDAWLAQLRFPHDAFRSGQRELASAVWRSVRQERCLVAEAPTGIGKTVATVFPALKAMGTEGVDRVFFLTARTTGRALALHAAASIRQANALPVLRVLELTARDKACEHPELACNGDSCPLARGFYDRLPSARHAARAAEVLDRATIRSVALAHDVCPYWLGLEMARWCDLVVGDYNHWYDGHPLLAALAEENEWRAVVLVDEAHNLPDRARAMYSRRLTSQQMRDAKAVASAAVRGPLTRLTRAWNRLTADVTGDYRAHDALPLAFLDALGAVTTAIGVEAEDEPERMAPALLDLHLAALELKRLAMTFDTHSIFDLTIAGATRRGSSVETTIGIRNLVPSPFLQPRHASAHAVVLFSATMTPHAFYADLLGLPANTVRTDVATPFTPDQLTVRIVRDISTRLQHRERSLAPFAALVASQFDRVPGNYLVFVSSHAYLRRLADVLAAQHPRIPCWTQERRMSEPDRDAFLERFVPGGRGVGFAVLGGVFAEGIDLPGDRLIGAFVATLGLPQFDAVNEAYRERLQARYGAGYEYAYLYPGLRRVIQAAGRVIRSTSDRGTLHLIDDRFAKREVRALLPGWWKVREDAVAESTRRSGDRSRPEGASCDLQDVP